MEEIKLRTAEWMLEKIKRNEGFSSHAYQDGKGWSIGYGHYFGPGVEPPYTTVTQEQADKLFLEDCAEREKQINTYLHVDLNDNQWSALFDLVYNAGIGHALAVINFLNQDRFSDAVQEWRGLAIQTYNHNEARMELSQPLVERRKEEVDLFLKGV